MYPRPTCPCKPTQLRGGGGLLIWSTAQTFIFKVANMHRALLRDRAQGEGGLLCLRKTNIGTISISVGLEVAS